MLLGTISRGRPARSYLQQQYTDTGCNLEDLPKTMDDRDEWRGRFREIPARGTIYIYIYKHHTIEKE